MPRKKTARSSNSKAERLAYRQGANTVYVESLPDRWAVQYVPDARAAVKKKLSALGEVEELPEQRLFLLRLNETAAKTTLAEQAQELLQRGQIEFCQPVLRDEQSQLQQIPTGEISVRFKHVPSTQQLRSVEKKYGLQMVRQNEFVPSQFVVKAPAAPAEQVLDIASQLDAEDEVEFAAPNFIAEFER
ncbi:MAG TPA: hypothetical protein VFZ34_31055 [Blastocatellia bacterium]|nr:hypothetical protein [Blastocatellia bacterium]